MREITTQRLTLHAIRDGDKEALLSMLTSERVYNTYMVPDLVTQHACDKLFSSFKALSERDDRYVFGIYEGDTFLGVIHDTAIEGNTLELGYALHPAYFGQGIMTEALRGMIDYLFTQGFAEIFAAAFEENEASRRVMQASGMCVTGKTERIAYRGKTHTCVYYSVKRSYEDGEEKI